MIQIVPITALYASLFGLLLIALSLRVVAQRRASNVGLGDQGVEPLSLAIRAQANLVEYVPMTLILLLLLELNGGREWVLHALGSALLVARLLHAWGLSHSQGVSFGRFYGTLVTWLVLVSAAVLNIASLF